MSHVNNHKKLNAVLYLLVFSRLQGDTVVDCYEVSTSHPYLSQGPTLIRSSNFFFLFFN